MYLELKRMGSTWLSRNIYHWNQNLDFSFPNLTTGIEDYSDRYEGGNLLEQVNLVSTTIDYQDNLLLTVEEETLNDLRVINILEGYYPVDFQRITQFYLDKISNMNIYDSAPTEKNSHLPNFNSLYSLLNNEQMKRSLI